jgi:hypothetical protein
MFRQKCRLLELEKMAGSGKIVLHPDFHRVGSHCPHNVARLMLIVSVE